MKHKTRHQKIKWHTKTFFTGKNTAKTRSRNLCKHIAFGKEKAKLK